MVGIPTSRPITMSAVRLPIIQPVHHIIWAENDLIRSALRFLWIGNIRASPESAGVGKFCRFRLADSEQNNRLRLTPTPAQTPTPRPWSLLSSIQSNHCKLNIFWVTIWNNSFFKPYWIDSEKFESFLATEFRDPVSHLGGLRALSHLLRTWLRAVSHLGG